MIDTPPPSQPRNPLHGLTLEVILTAPGSLCIACTVATEVFRADEAKDQAAVCLLHTRAVPTMSAARKAPSRRVAPESPAGGVTRLVDISISTAPRALPPIDSDSNAIGAGYAEAP